LFDRCAASMACNSKFPALRDDFRALRTRLQTAPVKMQIPDPLTATLRMRRSASLN